jgi:hypothetical protein
MQVKCAISLGNWKKNNRNYFLKWTLAAATATLAQNEHRPNGLIIIRRTYLKLRNMTFSVHALGQLLQDSQTKWMNWGYRVAVLKRNVKLCHWPHSSTRSNNNSMECFNCCRIVRFECFVDDRRDLLSAMLPMKHSIAQILSQGRPEWKCSKSCFISLR